MSQSFASGQGQALPLWSQAKPTLEPKGQEEGGRQVSLKQQAMWCTYNKSSKIRDEITEADPVCSQN